MLGGVTSNLSKIGVKLVLFLAAVTKSGKPEWNGGTGSHTIIYAGVFEEGGVAGGKYSSKQGFEIKRGNTDVQGIPMDVYCRDRIEA